MSSFFLFLKTFLPLSDSLAAMFWECIIVHIRRHLGNLKKTYLGHHRLPNLGIVLNVSNIGIQRLAADVWMHANVWNIHSNIGMHSNVGGRSLNKHWQRICTIICSPIFSYVKISKTKRQTTKFDKKNEKANKTVLNTIKINRQSPIFFIAN